MNRRSRVERETTETKIMLELLIDGSGNAKIGTGLPFVEHMLDLFCRHGHFDLNLEATGDIAVDAHHLVEDLGICLGRALKEALGSKEGIKRYGFSAVPMDETLVTAVVDLSGRSWLHYGIDLPPGVVGGIDGELFREFWQAFVNEGRLNLHLVLNHGTNKHHIIEASFKATARAIAEAVLMLEGLKGVLSTKGELE
ncbi:MAG: imidazoleglycerol-phosphate dehydratase HisB, partial [Firmicutes bacterium]|nr:imidazoleglycerol-phosphate dehydratase HisB [Bacillota bacterium]